MSLNTDMPSDVCRLELVVLKQGLSEVHQAYNIPPEGTASRSRGSAGTAAQACVVKPCGGVVPNTFRVEQQMIF